MGMVFSDSDAPINLYCLAIGEPGFELWEIDFSLQKYFEKLKIFGQYILNNLTKQNGSN